MDRFLKILDDPKMSAAIAALLLAMVTWFTRQLTKIPRIFKDKANAQRNEQSVIDGYKRDHILTELKKTGAIYIHLVRYHNGGGALKRGSPLKLSVDIEKIGAACDICKTKCRQYGVQPIIREWQNIMISGSWCDVVKNTVINDRKINVVKIDDLDTEHQQLWKEVNIAEYREIFVKHNRTCFYTIGLSYCPRFIKKRNMNGSIMHAAQQIHDLL